MAGIAFYFRPGLPHLAGRSVQSVKKKMGLLAFDSGQKSVTGLG